MLYFDSRLYRPQCVLLVTITLFVPTLLYSTLSTAEMRVIQSNSPRYKVGQELPDDDPLDLLGPGCRITVLKLRSNKTEYSETVVVEGDKVPYPPIGGARELPNLPCDNR